MLLLVLAMANMASGLAQSETPATPLAATVAPVPGASTTPTPPSSPDPASPTSPSDPASPSNSTSPAVTATPNAPATTASPAPPPPAGDATLSNYITEPRDPWVKTNRAIFSFDRSIDRVVLAPVAHGYAHVVPKVVRYHVTSALLNLGEPLTATNDLLQLRLGSMSKAVFRFIVNSTLGVAGLFDVAKTSGVPIHVSDFGQTLGRYGVKPGNYVILPVLGPSNVRDAFGRLVDNFIDPVEFLIGGITSVDGISIFLLEGVDLRERADETLKTVYSATDPYAFARSAYTQYRSDKISDATGKQAALPDFEAVPGTP